MKAREIRERLRGKVDPDLSLILETLAEDMVETRKVLVEAVNLTNMVVDTMDKFELIATNLKQKLEKVGKEEENPETGAMQ